MDTLRRIADWRGVRALGELQALTRASYVMLVVVPILAGLWPGVRLVVNRYNQAVTDAASALEVASVRLETEAQRIERVVQGADAKEQHVALASNAAEILGNLKNRIDSLLADHSIKTIENTALPDVWVWAFLASLAVFLAHMLYQMWAPDLVRQTRSEQYALDRRNLHAEKPSEGSLRRAQRYLEVINEGHHYFRFEVPDPPVVVDEGARRRWELDVVEQGARAEYLFVAGRSLAKAWTVALLYVIGIVIILFIAISQTLSILRAADWIAR